MVSEAGTSAACVGTASIPFSSGVARTSWLSSAALKPRNHTEAPWQRRSASTASLSLCWVRASSAVTAAGERWVNIDLPWGLRIAWLRVLSGGSPMGVSSSGHCSAGWKWNAPPLAPPGTGSCSTSHSHRVSSSRNRLSPARSTVAFSNTPTASGGSMPRAERRLMRRQTLETKSNRAPRWTTERRSESWRCLRIRAGMSTRAVSCARCCWRHRRPRCWTRSPRA
jgi:hypothetical protein